MVFNIDTMKQELFPLTSDNRDQFAKSGMQQGLNLS